LSDEVLAWLFVWSEVQFAYGLADATAIPERCCLLPRQYPEWFYLLALAYQVLEVTKQV